MRLVLPVQLEALRLFVECGTVGSELRTLVVALNARRVNFRSPGRDLVAVVSEFQQPRLMREFHRIEPLAACDKVFPFRFQGLLPGLQFGGETTGGVLGLGQAAVAFVELRSIFRGARTFTFELRPRFFEVASLVVALGAVRCDCVSLRVKVMTFAVELVLLVFEMRLELRQFVLPPVERLASALQFTAQLFEPR